MSFRFADAHVLWWILSLPILFSFFIFFTKKQEQRIRQYVDENLMGLLIENLSTAKIKIKWLLKILAFGFFILAFARPQSGEKSVKVKNEGIELMILFDVSRSMLAEDVKPSRLEFAKKEIFRFLSLVSGHKAGVLVFAGSSFLLSPLTTDMSALKMLVESLTPDSVSKQGTEYRKALSEAKEAFERGGVEKSTSTSVTRAVVIVSDGEDNEVGAISAAKVLSESGIKIFVLGFGTEKGGPIPLKNSRGEFDSYFKDANGKVVYTKAETKLLRELAKTGSGSFYSVGYGTDSIERLISDLNRLKKTELEGVAAVEYEELFQFFLVLALLFAFANLLITEKKGLKGFWRGRFEKVS